VTPPPSADAPNPDASAASRLRIALPVFLVAAVLIALRRPDQIAFPEVWNEDGIFVLPQLLEHGFAAVFEPVNGYLIVPSRLISWIALSISLEHYPAYATWLGILAQAACVATVAAAPTFLRAKPLCALALLALPMNAEVYALPQYTFWWTTLFLFLALIWEPGRSQRLRNVLLVIGGVSSPMVVVLTPLFALRAAATRRRDDVIATLVVAAVAAVQLYFVFVGDPAETVPLELRQVWAAIGTFFAGWTVLGGRPGDEILGLAVCALLAGGALALPKDQRLPYVLLGLTLGGAIASAMLRVPADLISPVGNGPRYFFLPLVLIFWMLVWLASTRRAVLFAAALALMAAAAPITLAHYQRGQEPLRPWSQAVRECRERGADMPVQHDGLQVHQHKVPYGSELCRKA
jgi:hypothetical protein